VDNTGIAVCILRAPQGGVIVGVSRGCLHADVSTGPMPNMQPASLPFEARENQRLGLTYADRRVGDRVLDELVWADGSTTSVEFECIWPSNFVPNGGP
jgi:hypothetical protein